MVEFDSIELGQKTCEEFAALSEIVVVSSEIKYALSKPEVTWYGNDKVEAIVSRDEKRGGVSGLDCACCLTKLEVVLELVIEFVFWEGLSKWDRIIKLCLGTFILAVGSLSVSLRNRSVREVDNIDFKSNKFG